MTDSNKAFDASLKSRCEDWGIREVKKVELLAHKSGISLIDRIEMPANNLFLTWKKD